MKNNILDNIITQTLKNRISFWYKLIIFLISALNIAACVIDYGFVLNDKEQNVIFNIYNVAWWCYFITFLVRIVFQWKMINRKTISLTTITGLLLLFSALPKFIPITEASDLYNIWQFFSNKHFIILTLLLFAALEVSSGIINFINKKTNPALLMTVCFAIIILFGALLLLLPRSTQEHIVLPVADAIFFMGGTGLFNQFALRDMIGSETFSSLISTLLYILGFTFIIEA